ncbi:MAG: two-component sensor histidine kinase [Gammaproteobacteria bacterium]|nr:two-component sensor histidine kinase [Gammaproteobacteria bacterium]|tara:strand:+ start:413 stop:1726 length:1314 start_codon:yes stop_codon:yes gene_type:complete
MNKNTAFKFKTSEDSSDNPTQVRLRTLTLIRWIAVLGQLFSLMIVFFILDFRFPIAYALIAVAVSVGINVFTTILKPAVTRLNERGAALYLGFDIIQLAALICFTGGLQNPFSILFLVPVTISATILPLRATAALSGLAVICISLLAFFHWPLPWENAFFTLPPLYLIALWVALVVGVFVIASYTARVSVEARRMVDALTATKMALAREQRLSAIGALAAAAAHQLGTPLSTIAVAAQELSKELPEENGLSEDARLIRDEVARCREILRRLATLGVGETDAPYGRITLSTLVEVAAESHRREGDKLNIVVKSIPKEAEPLVPRRAEIVHGLGNILENAFQFAKSEVNVEISWDSDQIIIVIKDDGPGFLPAVLSRLGEPYISGFQGNQGLGLGIFIAKTLLERTGAGLEFFNQHPNGGSVKVSWSTGFLKTLSAEGM